MIWVLLGLGGFDWFGDLGVFGGWDLGWFLVCSSVASDFGGLLCWV